MITLLAETSGSAHSAHLHLLSEVDDFDSSMCESCSLCLFSSCRQRETVFNFSKISLVCLPRHFPQKPTLQSRHSVLNSKVDEATKIKDRGEKKVVYESPPPFKRSSLE